MNAQPNLTQMSNGQRWMIMIPLLIGGFAAILNETLLNVAFPSLTQALHVSTGTVQWLATAYMLTIGILVPVTAFLLESYTTKSLYLAAMGLFFIGSLFCALSANFPMLLVFRILQGAGTGMLIPIMLNTILALYPPEQRGSAIGKCLIVIIVAPALGPTLSGLVLQVADWRWLFFGLLPIAVFAIVFGAFTLVNVSHLTRPRIDLLSVALSTIGFGGFIYGVCSLETLGVQDPSVDIALVAGVLGLVFFSVRQFRLKQPMLDLRCFSYPLFRPGMIILVIAVMTPFAFNIILPTYLQEVRGVTPLNAGLLMLPAGIMSAFFAPVAGAIFDRHGARALIAIGFLLSVVALVFLARLPESITLPQVVVLHCLVFAATGLIITPCQTSALNQLPRSLHAHGVAIVNTLLQIASALGSALFIGMMAARQSRLMAAAHGAAAMRIPAALAGMRLAFTAALVLTVAAFLLSLFYKKPNPEAAAEEAVA